MWNTAWHSNWSSSLKFYIPWRELTSRLVPWVLPGTLEGRWCRPSSCRVRTRRPGRWSGRCLWLCNSLKKISPPCRHLGTRRLSSRSVDSEPKKMNDSVRCSWLEFVSRCLTETFMWISYEFSPRIVMPELKFPQRTTTFAKKSKQHDERQLCSRITVEIFL